MLNKTFILVRIGSFIIDLSFEPITYILIGQLDSKPSHWFIIGSKTFLLVLNELPIVLLVHFEPPSAFWLVLLMNCLSGSSSVCWFSAEARISPPKIFFSTMLFSRLRFFFRLIQPPLLVYIPDSKQGKNGGGTTTQFYLMQSCCCCIFCCCCCCFCCCCCCLLSAGLAAPHAKKPQSNMFR